jgi:hypothetical protein
MANLDWTFEELHVRISFAVRAPQETESLAKLRSRVPLRHATHASHAFLLLFPGAMFLKKIPGLGNV